MSKAQKRITTCGHKGCGKVFDPITPGHYQQGSVFYCDVVCFEAHRSGDTRPEGLGDVHYTQLAYEK